MIISNRMGHSMQGSEQILYGFNGVENYRDHIGGKIIRKESGGLSFLFFVGLLILFFQPAAAQQPSVTLAWSPNTETYLYHYIMYRDTIPGTMKYLAAIPKPDTVYVDTSVFAGKTYYYKLTASDSNGYESDPSEEVSITVEAISSTDGEGNNAIGNFVLYQNYPNPFNPTTTIAYTLAKNSKVEITVYDLLGKEIRTLVDEFKVAGNYQTIWNGKNNNGGNVSSGVYFYRMTAENYVAVKRLILQK